VSRAVRAEIVVFCQFGIAITSQVAHEWSMRSFALRFRHVGVDVSIDVPSVVATRDWGLGERPDYTAVQERAAEVAWRLLRDHGPLRGQHWQVSFNSAGTASVRRSGT